MMPFTNCMPPLRLPTRAASLVLLTLLILTTLGCATTQKPREPFIPNTSVETLAASVSLSVTTPEGSSGGTGYLLYRRPDLFH
ncbi:outer membrane lipoprotein LolB, partial [bacterium]|nr:outer membrane lipoprotein LolB [bacterium]